ncbi:sugar ABC transporter ATP-binding protein [Candidatus Amarobacter glycogenicus]|uniref:sugar ABC transporter ATP-binding protein n=1 Tax=Candidatus Amarobacter glycogenicus TaxID=3140699 RepID=UPI002A0E1161|nr:sugar ABC transporter ATP-binding protein [Dehalococcoidia bacterium]
MTDVSKSYPGVQALKDVHFELRAGEIHCLVGENGAGKSTLMRILSGAERPDSGSIAIGDHRYSALDPVLGHQLGIGVIYQETDLVLKMTVAENMFLGHEPRTGYGALDRRRMNDEAQAILRRIGVEIAPSTLVRILSPSNRQLVQIAKALSWHSQILVMDEPGAALSDHELARLFDRLNLLVGQGIGVVYISHRLGEILRIGHRVTVLRDGEHVATAPVKDVDLDQLLRWMVGRPLGEQYGKKAAFTEEIVLSVRHLSAQGHFEDVSLDLRAGEVLGLAGLVGAGRSALLGCLFGAIRPTQGAIYLGQQAVQFGSPHDAVQRGFGWCRKIAAKAGWC